jgi:tight adherence protein C
VGSLVDTLRDPAVLLAVFTCLAVIATIVTIALPLLSPNQLQNRMRAVSVEREKLRNRERSRLELESSRSSLRRAEAKGYMTSLVSRLSLRKALADDATEAKLRMAGYRGSAPLTVFLFARFVLPLALFALTLLYVFGILDLDRPFMIKLGIAIFVGAIGFYLPNIYVKNIVDKRQQSIKRAFPDALDLMLICVESGMSIENAMRKVADEIGSQSIPLAEELTLTTAELSFLPERRSAYENLVLRTGLDGVKAVSMALIQAERYGTPLGTALRTMSQENRDIRMNEAEKKASALPPKLTVPMIVFFLPVLFAVIMAPAIIQISAL